MTKHNAHVLAYKKAVLAGELSKAAEALDKWKMRKAINEASR